MPASNKISKKERSLGAFDPLKILIRAANPSEADAHYEEGMRLLKLGRLQKALAGFEQASLADPSIFARNDHKKLSTEESLLFKILNQIDAKMKHSPTKALLNCNKAIELFPSQARLHNIKAYLLKYYLKQYEAAIESQDKAIELDPSAAIYHNNKGLIFREMGARAEALKHFNKAIELDPSLLPIAYYNKALLLEELGRLEEAQDNYKMVLKLEHREHPDLESRLKAAASSQIEKLTQVISQPFTFSDPLNSLARPDLSKKQLTAAAGGSVEINLTNVLSVFALFIMALGSVYCLRRHLAKQADNPHRLRPLSETVLPHATAATSNRAASRRARRARADQAAPVSAPAPVSSVEPIANPVAPVINTVTRASASSIESAPQTTSRLVVDARSIEAATSAPASRTESVPRTQPRLAAGARSVEAATSARTSSIESAPRTPPPRRATEAHSIDMEADPQNYPHTFTPPRPATGTSGIDAVSSIRVHGTDPESVTTPPRPGLR